MVDDPAGSGKEKGDADAWPSPHGSDTL